MAGGDYDDSLVAAADNRQLAARTVSLGGTIERVSESGTESARYQLSIVEGVVSGDGKQTRSHVEWLGNMLAIEHGTYWGRPGEAEKFIERRGVVASRRRDARGRNHETSLGRAPIDSQAGVPEAGPEEDAALSVTPAAFNPRRRER
jgi:hypothetical protein